MTINHARCLARSESVASGGLPESTLAVARPASSVEIGFGASRRTQAV